MPCSGLFKSFLPKRRKIPFSSPPLHTMSVTFTALSVYTEHGRSVCCCLCILWSPTQTHHGKTFSSISHIVLPRCLVLLVCNDQLAQKSTSKTKTKKTKMINWASPKSKATAAGALWRRPCTEQKLLWHRPETFAETWRRGVTVAALSPDSNTMSKNCTLLWLWRGGTSGYMATGGKKKP